MSIGTEESWDKRYKLAVKIIGVALHGGWNKSMYIWRRFLNQPPPLPPLNPPLGFVVGAISQCGKKYVKIRNFIWNVGRKKLAKIERLKKVGKCDSLRKFDTIQLSPPPKYPNVSSTFFVKQKTIFRAKKNTIPPWGDKNRKGPCRRKEVFLSDEDHRRIFHKRRGSDEETMGDGCLWNGRSGTGNHQESLCKYKRVFSRTKRIFLFCNVHQKLEGG